MLEETLDFFGPRHDVIFGLSILRGTLPQQETQKLDRQRLPGEQPFQKTFLRVELRVVSHAKSSRSSRSQRGTLGKLRLRNCFVGGALLIVDAERLAGVVPETELREVAVQVLLAAVLIPRRFGTKFANRTQRKELLNFPSLAEITNAAG